MHPPAGGWGGDVHRGRDWRGPCPARRCRVVLRDRRAGRARRVTGPHKSLRKLPRVQGAEGGPARPLARGTRARGRSGAARSGAEVRVALPGVLLLAVVVIAAGWYGALQGFECCFGRLTGGGSPPGVQGLGWQARSASGCHARRRLSERSSTVGGGWSVGVWAPGSPGVSAGRVRCGRGSRSWVPAGRPWSAGSVAGALKVGWRVAGEWFPWVAVKRSGPGCRAVAVVARGVESSSGSMALVGPDRSPLPVRSGPNVPVVGPASAAMVSQNGEGWCRPGRSLGSQGSRSARRSDPAVGEGGRVRRTAGRQSAPGRRSLVGAVVARVRSPAGSKSAAGVDGPGRRRSSRGRRGGRESGVVGAGRRGIGSGHRVQPSSKGVAGVAGAGSRRRPGGLDRRLNRGPVDGQRVGRGRTGQEGRRSEVQAWWRRAGMGAGVYGAGGILSMMRKRPLALGHG